MTLSLYLLLVPYLVFLLIWSVFSFVAVFHMVKFGFRGIVSVIAVSVYIGVSAFLLVVSYGYLADIDWRAEAAIFENIPGFFSFLKIN